MNLRTLVDIAALLAEQGEHLQTSSSRLAPLVTAWHNECDAELTTTTSTAGLTELLEEALVVELLLQQLSFDKPDSPVLVPVRRLCEKSFDWLRRSRLEIAVLLRLERLERRLHSRPAHQLSGLRWHVPNRDCQNQLRSIFLSQLSGLALEYIPQSHFQQTGPLKSLRQRTLERPGHESHPAREGVPEGRGSRHKFLSPPPSV